MYHQIHSHANTNTNGWIWGGVRGGGRGGGGTAVSVLMYNLPGIIRSLIDGIHTVSRLFNAYENAMLANLYPQSVTPAGTSPLDESSVCLVVKSFLP